MSQEIKLIVGLGNPGSKYEDTRHNIGMMALDQLERFDWKSKFKGLYSQLDDGEKRYYFLKPQTYMNLSGESIRALCDFFKIKPSEVLILHDELDLPLGTITFKKGGGLAGHNGLKSTAQHLNTNDFYRLRIGIGRPAHGDVSRYVLTGFQGDENIIVEKQLEGVCDALRTLMKSGYERAANKFSRKSFA
ncbi:MAG: aminoacyl-tRNA hydrolase [Bacteriovoracaceae bacterium]